MCDCGCRAFLAIYGDRVAGRGFAERQTSFELQIELLDERERSGLRVVPRQREVAVAGIAQVGTLLAVVMDQGSVTK